MSADNGRPAPDYPDAVVFEERDGIYWLGQRDLRLIEAAIGVQYGAVRVGFDRDGAVAQALSLMNRGLKVGLRRGATIRMLRPVTQSEVKPVTSSPIFLAPQRLLDEHELDALQAALGRRSCPFRSAYERWQDSFSEGDKPAIYVYRVAQDMYEVDWQLTSASETTFHGMALAAYRSGRELACRLVAPRRLRPSSVDSTDEPAIFGQLHLALL